MWDVCIGVGKRSVFFQCLVIGEITCSHLMVVLNKTDLIEEGKRETHISKVGGSE